MENKTEDQKPQPETRGDFVDWSKGQLITMREALAMPAPPRRTAFIQYGEPFAIGVLDPLPPLSCWPAGKYRIRMRPQKPVTVYVRTVTSICMYYARIRGGALVPHMLMGSNIRPLPKP